MKTPFATFAKFCWIFTRIADFLTDLLLKCWDCMRLQRCKNMQILQIFKNAVKCIFSCKISFWYSRERARQKFATFSKNAFSKNAFSKNGELRPVGWKRGRGGRPGRPGGGREGWRRGALVAEWRRRQRASVGEISAKCCSFSAVSAPIFVSKYAFCSIFQNLPDSQTEIFEIWQNFANFATFAIVCWNFTKIAVF